MSRINKDSSNTITLAYLQIENGQKMIIHERELLVYARTNHIGKVFAVMRGKKEKPKWELEFQIKGEKERAILVSSLNKPRQFPRLNNMVEMLQNWCPDIDVITLSIKFEK